MKGERKEHNMYIIDCQNCREANQINDKMVNKTIRCHICQKIIQIGEVKKEVIIDINDINKIDELEEPKNEIILPHHISCPCHICKTDRTINCVIFIIVMIIIPVILVCCW